VTFKSDNESDNNYGSDDSKVDTNSLADKYYRQQLEKEYNCMFNIRESNFSFHPTFLAMVMAKIQGTIMGQTCTMLIDNGSELNMMVQLTQAKLQLPMDPSGHNWVLRGVSSHQVNLVGLCHNVPVQVSRVPLPHNFFITSDNIGQKDIILGQPWLFSYSMRIDYAHGEGMNLQVWQDGDHEGRSVHVTLPIMLAPHNMFPIQLIKH
jgi:Retroviral aspartyl protease